MIPLRLIFFLIIGTILMTIPIAMQAKWYGLRLWKNFIISVILTITGTVGTYLMFYLETGRLGGISFFGAIFFVPIVFVLLSFIIRIPYGILMDLCAPAECVMLCIMKIQCVVCGCCGGRILFTTAEGVAVRFPSQIVELFNALIIAFILLYLSRKPNNKGSIYWWYMIIYGCSRFVLNLLRDTTPIFWGLANGSLWSLLSIAIGVLLLFIFRKTRKKKYV